MTQYKLSFMKKAKPIGLVSYIQFSLGHIFASTIKLDYLNSEITII